MKGLSRFVNPESRRFLPDEGSLSPSRTFSLELFLGYMDPSPRLENRGFGISEKD
jgi:hypothetical protein